MNSTNLEILAAINTNDLRAIETVLNGLGVEADRLGRGSDEERLHVPSYGTIVFDGRSEEAPGYYVISLDSTDLSGWDYSLTPDELADALTELVEFAAA